MMLDGWTAEHLQGNEQSKTALPMIVGWVCPICGRGLSPFINVCPCKNDGKGWEITCKTK